MLITYGFYRKSSIPLAIGCVGQLYVYSATGLKAVLFCELAIFGIFFLYKSRYAILWLAVGLTSMIILANAADSLSEGEIFWTGHFTMRFLAMPAVLTSYYFDFFSQNQFCYLSHSIFRWFLDYPYPLEPPMLIGSVYIGNPNCNANGNIWADGYANFGLPGVLLVSIALGFTFWLYDSAAEACDTRTATMLFVTPSMALSNAAFLTSIVTNGIGLTILLCLFSPIFLKRTRAESWSAL